MRTWNVKNYSASRIILRFYLFFAVLRKKDSPGLGFEPSSLRWRATTCSNQTNSLDQVRKFKKILYRILFQGTLLDRINLPLFSTVVPAIIFMFLSCRPFVVITTLSTGLVGVEVTSVSWLGQLTVVRIRQFYHC